MKYIRTKDGIWKYNIKENSAERPNKKFGCNQIWLNIKQEDILKEADTIEKLCDVLVIDWKDNTWNTTWNLNYHHKASAKEIVNTYDLVKKRIKNVFGAIWTNKGLIYVAKMNEEGELELL